MLDHPTLIGQSVRGRRGVMGWEGPRGSRGALGLEGKQGKQGKVGPRGFKGDPGKDGIDTDIEKLKPLAAEAVSAHEKEYDHSLIDPYLIGSKELDEENIGDKKVLQFDEKSNKIVYATIKDISKKLAPHLLGRGFTLPTQTGNSGKFLTTNGLIASWGAAATDTFTAENKDSVTILAGQPVSAHSSGTGIIRAVATANTTRVLALATESIAAGATGTFLASGMLTLTDWTSVTGATTLVARATYLLSATTATLTTTAPTTTGYIVQQVGSSVAPDTLHVFINQTILL